METDDPLGLMLREALGTAQVLAVVDAAHVDYLQDTLTMERFTFDPLYLDEVDNPSVASGPHLVHPTGPAQIARLREIVGDAPACVWWIWPDEPGAGRAIHRHLRGLNMIEIPKDRFDVPPEERGPGHEAVLFRHGDANIMAAMLSVLYAAQLPRLFGRAQAIIVDAPNYDHVQRFDATVDGGYRGQMLLRILDGAQYDALTQARLDNSHQRIAAYLRRHLPPQKQGMTDGEIGALVLESDATGRDMGIKTERGHARWAYLMMMSDGQAASLPEMRSFLELGGDPDRRVMEAIAYTAWALETGNIVEPPE